MFTHFCLQKLILLWAIITGWHKVKVFATVEGLHSRVALIEAVFSRDLITPRKMINLLKTTKVAINVRFDAG